MEMYLYEKKIRELKKKHDKMISSFKVTGTISLIASIFVLIISSIIFIKVINDEDWFIFSFSMLLTFVGITDLMIMLLVCTNKRTRFYFYEVNKLVVDILRAESNFDIVSGKDKKEYIKMLKETRVQDGDMISVYSAFELFNSDIKGSIFNVIFSRSNGKTSYETLRGLVIRFSVNTNLNMQIRNDHYAPFKLRRYKDVDIDDARIYLPKEGGKYGDVILECYNDLLKSFDAKSVGIDVCNGEVTFYINYMNKMIRIRKYDSNDIENYCRMYIDTINKAIEIKERIENYYG